MEPSSSWELWQAYLDALVMEVTRELIRYKREERVARQQEERT